MVFLANTPILGNYEVSAGEVLTFFCIQNPDKMTTETNKIIKELAEPIAEQRDMYVVDVEIKQDQGSVVWVLVDSEEGNVNVDHCSEISRELAFLMDKQDLFSGRYRLNVSTPGLSRPLSDLRQYKKNAGRTARIKYKTDEGYNEVEGTIKQVLPGSIKLTTDNGTTTDIEFSAIAETKIIPKI